MKNSNLFTVGAAVALLVAGSTNSWGATIFDDSGNELTDPTITASQTRHNSDYDVDNIFDDDVSGSGNGAGSEYATGNPTSAAADAFVEFDFGVATEIGGFVFYQRGNNNDTVLSFNLIFDDTSDFSSPLSTLTFATTGTPDFALQGDNAVNNTPDRQEFEFSTSITARYVKWDVTSSDSNFDGASEMEFWSVPEPTSLLLAVISCFCLGLGVKRRPRR